MTICNSSGHKYTGSILFEDAKKNPFICKLCLVSLMSCNIWMTDRKCVVIAVGDDRRLKRTRDEQSRGRLGGLVTD